MKTSAKIFLWGVGPVSESTTVDSSRYQLVDRCGKHCLCKLNFHDTWLVVKVNITLALPHLGW